MEKLFSTMRSGKDIIVASDVPVRDVKVSPSSQIRCPWCNSVLECHGIKKDAMPKAITKQYTSVDGSMACFCPCCSVGKRGFILIPAGTVYAIETKE